MIDFVSMEVINTPVEHLLNNPNFVFSRNLDSQTGELIPDEYGAFNHVAEFGNDLKIKIKTFPDNRTDRIFVKGSIHKFLKGNNYSDFTFHEIQTSIRLLTEQLNIPLNRFKIHCIEFGVNIHPDMVTNSVLRQIISHRGKEYELRTFNGTGYFKKFTHSQFECKIYNKGLQYKLTDEILRFEVKVSKMAYLQTKNIAIVSLSDLQKPDIYKQLLETLIKTYSGLIFTDNRIKVNSITKPKEKTLFNHSSNPNFWTELNQSCKGKPKTFLRRVKQWENVLVKYAPDNMKATIENMISNKWNELQKNVPFLPIPETGEMSLFYPHIVGNKQTVTQRYCLTCGRDISNQKEGSNYCSELLFGKRVKQCRNKVSNLKQHEKRHYQSKTLFDIDSLLQPDMLRLKKIAFNSKQ